MNRRALLAVAVALFAVLAAVVIGTVAYRAGVEQGVVEAGRLAAAPPAAGAPAYPYGYHGYYGHPHWVFAPFGFFFPLLFFFLTFGLLRRLFWAGRCGGYGRWRGGVPPSFEEWHRRAHEGQGDVRV